MKKTLLLFFIFCLLSGLQATNLSRNYLVRTFIDKNGKSIDEYQVPGFPPEKLMPAVEIPQNVKGVVTISNVPAFDWCYGCSATSAAMMAGHYDNTIFPNMYSGPQNGGVVPMNNSGWGSGECPLSATHQGYDGLSVKGHVDDYYSSYDSTVDPYYGNWTEHANADCTGDYMGTNQYQHYGNKDGATTFYYYTNGAPLYDYTGCEPSKKDGCHGLREFFESRGYSVATNYSQYIYGYNGNTQGFTYAQYKAEIDAGRPVLIQLDGHTMLGFGYDDTSGNIIYIHDTWDHNNHTMTWGGTYSNMQHIGVTVIALVDPTITVTAPNGGESWKIGSTYNITWNSQYVTNVNILLYNGTSVAGSIVSNYSASLGTYSWTIPQGITPNSNYFIRIEDSNASLLYDMSDATFTILPQPVITVTAPNGGENWQIGSSFNINWTTSNAGANVKIELYSNNVLYKTIVTSTPNSGSYLWDIPTSYYAGTQYQIRIEDTSDANVYDLSGNFFTLSNPPGHGTDDNSANPSQPVSVDVEQIDIGGNTVDPNVQVDPTGSLTIQVEVDVNDQAQHTVDNPADVLISYTMDITGNISSNKMTFDLEYTGLSYNPPHPSYIYWWDTASSSWQAVSNPQWDTPSAEHVTFDLTIQNTKDGTTEVILGDNNPLPVVLSSFMSTLQNGNAILVWTTESETNNGHWNIYKSHSNNFGQSTLLNKTPIQAAGNSSTQHTYIYKDQTQLLPGNTYFYWLESVSFSGQTSLFGPVDLVINENNDTQTPDIIAYGLHQNYPNPFNPTTEISFVLKKSLPVYLDIYNIKGEKVKTLLNGKYFEKDKAIKIVWDGTNDNGKKLTSGIYFYKIKSGNYSETKKMLMLK